MRKILMYNENATQADFLTELVLVISKRIIPLTEAGVKNGNKIFGAAILSKNDFSVITVESNAEIINPLLHGEINCLNKFFEKDNQNRNHNVTDLIFLSTHEPCSMCLSAITWAGFDNIFYFFDYHDSKDKFQIPHDLKILDEVFKINDGNYNRSNSYWSAKSIIPLIRKLENPRKKILMKEVSKIKAEYKRLSTIYQGKKEQNDIPLR